MSLVATSNTLLYGSGVFTTVAILDGKLFLWEKHWRRLSGNAEKIGIDLSQFDEQSVVKKLTDVINLKGIKNGRARIAFRDETPATVWFAGEKRASLSVIASDRRALPDNLKLTVSPHLTNSTSPLAGIKSCNYLDPLMSHDEAKSRGFDEAIRLNERGEITSACMANVFWLKGDRLFTPGLTTGCLAGTTREFVLENIECSVVEAGVDAIREADEIFLTSAGIGVVQVAEFESKKLENIDHPIKKILPF